jgi:hypothetical protein
MMTMSQETFEQMMERYACSRTIQQWILRAYGYLNGRMDDPSTFNLIMSDFAFIMKQLYETDSRWLNAFQYIETRSRVVDYYRILIQAHQLGYSGRIYPLDVWGGVDAFAEKVNVKSDLEEVD